MATVTLTETTRSIQAYIFRGLALSSACNMAACRQAASSEDVRGKPRTIVRMWVEGDRGMSEPRS